MYRLFLSLRHLRSRFVNFIAVAGVMFGVAVLIVVTAVMDGFQEEVRQYLRGTLSHLTIVPDGMVAPPPVERIEQILVAADPRVRAVSPQTLHYLIFPYQRVSQVLGQGESGYHPLEAIGIEWEKERQASGLRDYILVAEDKDRPFVNAKAADYGKEEQTVLVSRAFLQAMGKLTPQERQETRPDLRRFLGELLDFVMPMEVDDPENPGEKTFKASTWRLPISAVFDAGDQQDDKSRLYVQREWLRRAAKIRQEYSELHVKLASHDQAPAVQERLRATSRGDPSTGDARVSAEDRRVLAGLDVHTWEDIRAPYLRTVKTEKVMLMVVLSFIVLLGGFTILATATLTVVEKTRDIGLLKALGATTSGVLTLFLGSGLLIGVLGGLLGLGLGLWFTANVNNVRDALKNLGVDVFPSDMYLFKEIPTVVDGPTVAAIVLGAMAVAFLSGLPPALRAASMDPATALRHE